VVFAGFIFLVLVSQLSAHVLAQAVLAYHPKGSAVLTEAQNISTILAVSAGALGLAFGGGVLLITKKKLALEVDVYRATGLPVGSAIRLMLTYHPPRPLAWLAGAAAIATGVDASFGLDALIPLELAACFLVLLLGWVVLLTVRSFGGRGFKEGRGRVG
jgi:hypothetical protein